MTRKPRSSPEDLASELAKPSFTPGRGDVPGLVALVIAGTDPDATRASRALANLGGAHVQAVIDAVDATDDEGARARLVGTLGQLARATEPASNGGVDTARQAVLRGLSDPSPRVRRAAANALGKLDHPSVREALLARWDASDVTPDERRALAEALGKVGGEAALERLRAIAPTDDAELARRRDRALLMADRSARRDEESRIAVDRAPPARLTIRLGTRGGLAPMLVAELAETGISRSARALGDRTVELALEGPWSTLFASRLWATASIRLPFALPRSPRRTDHTSGSRRRDRDDRVDDPEALAAAIVAAIVAPETRALLSSWTRGPIRWRVGFDSGHKRSIVWRVARDVTAAAPELVNDPTATTWDFVVAVNRADHAEDAGSLELVPRRFEDPRFAWRVADVPASSHPTVAAAIARLAAPRDGDRIWDPFCGAGAELVECARRAPGCELLGTDLDAAALEAARANASAANVDVGLAIADARTHDPKPVDIVVTNPPLGSRVQVDAASLLWEALPNLVGRLARGGRLVWITPSAKRTAPRAEQLGLVRSRSLAVDLGGVRGTLERWERP